MTMTYISSATLPTGTAASLTLSNIPATFTHLQVRLFGIYSTPNNMFLRVNGDTTSNYNWHHLWGDGATAQSNAAAASFIYIGYCPNVLAPAVSIIDILDYGNTNKNKTIRVLAGHDYNSVGEVALWSGLWRSTSAITSVTVQPGSGTFNAGSRIDLYGITTSAVTGA